MKLAGIFPAIVTPFDAVGVFQPDIYKQHIEHLYEAGVHGLYVLGQTGEGMQQSLPQRKQVLESAIKASPAGKYVIVHVGASTTADAVSLARHAETAGAHAVSSLPPLGAYDYSEIREYYETLGISTRLPLLLYHHPESCPTITPERALDLCSVPNVLGFKFTDFNLYLLSLIRAQGKLVFNGKDEQLAGGLLLGANGGIGTFYNIFPGLFVRIFDLASAGRWQEAAELQKRLNLVIHQILSLPMLQGVRELLAQSGFACGEALSPRRRLQSEEKRHLREIAANLPEEIAGYFLRSKVLQ
jgi:N-acetylneuraminate lyase